MYIFIFAFSLFIVDAYSTKYKTHKKTNGYDHRYESVTDGSPLMSHRITEFFEKQRLLGVLENPQIPLHVKLAKVSSTNIQSPNMLAGGLLKDWAFDMEEPVVTKKE